MAPFGSTPSDDELLDGVRRRDERTLTWLYRNYYPPIARHVQRNSGDDDAAREVFQRGLLILLEKTDTPDFRTDSKLYNYFFGICRYVWLRELRKRATEPITTIADTTVSEEAVDRAETFRLRRALYRKHFDRLGADCRAVIEAYLKGESMRELAARLGYTEAFARLKKFRCKEKLKRAIQRDPDYTDTTD